MKLSRRERRTAAIGAVVAGLTILIAWVLLPLGQSWRRLGRQLDPELRMFAVLRSRADQQEHLLARRARLARQLGSLLGGGKTAGGTEGKTDPPSPKQPSPSPETPRPAEGKPTDESSPASTPETRRLEAELETIIGKAGAKIRGMSARKSPTSATRLKYFRTVVLQVETANKVDSLVKMLHALESGPRFIRVHRLKLHRDLKKPNELSITMDILGYGPADET